MIRNKTGIWGEIFAVRYLRDRKYKILTVNYRSRFGEIDIIAEKKNTVCFVEVKTRSEDPMFRPSDAVDESKQSRIRTTAEHFISVFGISREARFDVCEVWLDDNYHLSEINYIKDAFQ